MKRINIAIDGPAGSGKGTTAKGLAEKLDYKYLDTGSMYRAFALAMKRKGVSVEEFKEEDLKEITISLKEGKIFLNEEDVSSEIRSSEIGVLAPLFSKIVKVREFLTKQQQEIIKEKAYVAEGRDTTTIVMPDAELKIYLDASLDVRAKRRLGDFERRGEQVSLEEVKQQLSERDEIDMNKGKYSLQKAKDALVIDTSEMGMDEQIEKVYELAQEKITL
jgi:cytidylate kinase